MAQEGPGIEPHDATAITAFENALGEFTDELNRLHIANGAPSYATIAAASVRPRLTKAGLNEMLAGTRFTSREALLEFVRVVTTSGDMDPAAATGCRVDPALADADAWRGRWQDVKLLQRQAQPARRRVRATVRQTLDDATLEAEALRKDAHAEADRIRTSAEADAARLRAQARNDADELLRRAGQRAAQARGLQPAEGEDLHARAAADGVGGRLRRLGRGLVLRPALRSLTAATVVAGLALAVILAGDSLTGTSGGCRQIQAGDQLVPRAGFETEGAVQSAAFAWVPGSFIPGPVRPIQGFPSSIPSARASPEPGTSLTPSPVPTPSSSPTPTPTAPRKPDPCAPQARAR
ncbi:hypothetical protein [Streptomyces sp. NBC_00354]|uniref:hypothetical protein n=1 Tax=Streptomyces sp. NBC_00354 TaxID=2975723 RepID=UPI002E25E15C